MIRRRVKWRIIITCVGLALNRYLSLVCVFVFSLTHIRPSGMLKKKVKLSL
jgi:hypothetical protein